jgi:phage gpG-like protein
VSIEARVEIKDEGVLAALSRLALEGSGKRELLDLIGIGEAENTRLRFVDQKGPNGQAWTPSIRAKTQGGDTLRDTGRLLNSITHVTSADYVEVGTNVLYAAMMHEGGTINATGGGYLKFKIGNRWSSKKSVTIPARPFLGLDSEGEQEVIGLIDQFLKTRI